MTQHIMNSILIINEKRHSGGAQRTVTELVKTLRQKNIPVQLLESDSAIQTIQALFSCRANIIIWNSYGKLSPLFCALSRLLHKENIVVIHSIWFYGNGSREGVHSRIYRFRQLWSRMTLGVKQFAWCIFSNKIAHISNYSKQLFFSVPFYRVFLHKNQVITYSGVDGDVFKRVSMDTKRKLRKKVGIGENDVVLLLVGRIEARKNYEDGFFILKELEKLLPQKNIVLYVVLSHGYFNDFEYLRYCFKQMERLGVGSRVRIVSGISMQEVKLFYAVADSFLMLSKKLETFGMVALEALSSGLPVFGFRACATGEVVTYEPDRYLFKISDIDGVASAIAQYTRLPVEKKRFIEQQLRESTRQYSWEAFAKRLLANFNIER